MAKLIKDINGEIIQTIESSIITLNSINSVVIEDEKFGLGNYIAFIQNYNNVSNIENLTKLSDFGLNNNKQLVILNTSY